MNRSERQNGSDNRAAQGTTRAIDVARACVERAARRFPGWHASRYYVYSSCVGLVIACVSVWFAAQLGSPDRNLMIAVVLTGACGGILFAVRQSILTWPELHGRSIHLGWIADCAYGVAGAFAVFLLVPGLSETASKGFEILFEPDTEAKEGMDLLEVIAVALVGGFGGRSVMQKAERRILPEDEPRARASDSAENRSDGTVAWSLAMRILNPAVDSPAPAEIARTIAASSPAAAEIAFDVVERSVRPTADDCDEGVVHLLSAIERSPFGRQNDGVSALLAKVLARKERWNEAIAAVDRALASHSTAGRSDDGLRQEYEAFRSLCQTRSAATQAC